MRRPLIRTEHPAPVATKSDRARHSFVWLVQQGIWVALCVLVGVAATGLVLAMAGWFAGALALGLGLIVGLFLAMRWRPGVPDLVPGASGAWTAALVVAFTVTGLNVAFPGEHLLTGRDAATYGNTAVWLANQGELIVDARVGPFDDSGLRVEAPGFYEIRDDGRLFPQFVHTLPVLMATAADLGDLNAMFVVNPLIGALALLVYFAFASRFVRPWLALASQVALAGSLVFIYFVRAPFTEVLALTFAFGGLWVLSTSRDGRDTTAAALGGLLLGAVTLARIDGLVLLLPVTFYGLLMERSADADKVAAARALRMGFLPPVVLALSDVALIAPYYFAIVLQQLVAIVAAYAVLLVADTLFRRVTPRGALAWLRARREGLAVAFAVTIVLLGAFAYFVRPWLAAPTAAWPYELATLQAREGLPIEPARTYAEQSMRWIGWYLGPVSLVAGLSGWALLAHAVMRGRARRMAPFLLLFSTVTLVYLWRPSINPDHLWAMRRFLPLTLPGWLFLAGWFLDRTLDLAKRSERPAMQRRAIRGAVAVTVVGMIVAPVIVTAPLLTTAEYSGLAAELERGCEELSSDAAVVILERDNAEVGIWLMHPLRAACGVPSAVANVDDPDDMRAVTNLAGDATSGPIHLVSVDPELLGLVTDSTRRPLLELPIQRIESTLSSPPSEVQSQQVLVLHAVLEPTD